MADFPPIPKTIIDALEALYPERSARLGDSHDKLVFEGGERSVVRFLKWTWKEQNEKEGDLTKVLPTSNVYVNS